MTKNNYVLCYRSVSNSLKCLRSRVNNNGKWTGSWLPVFYRKIYGFFYIVPPDLESYAGYRSSGLFRFPRISFALDLCLEATCTCITMPYIVSANKKIKTCHCHQPLCNPLISVKFSFEYQKRECTDVISRVSACCSGLVSWVCKPRKTIQLFVRLYEEIIHEL